MRAFSGRPPDVGGGDGVLFVGEDRRRLLDEIATCFRALTAVLLTPVPDGPARPASDTGVLPLTVARGVGCADLVPPLPGTGRLVPDGDGSALGAAGVTVRTSADGAVGWRSAEPVRAALIAGGDMTHLYWYEPTTTADDGLRPPDRGPDAIGTTPPLTGVELCLDGAAEPDLVAVCIRAGHLPVAGPSNYADGAFDAALGDRIAASVDPDDGTLAWRSDGPDITAVVTATSAPVLVEYDPPRRSGADVPFLGRGGTTGVVLFCGVTTIRWDETTDTR